MQNAVITGYINDMNDSLDIVKAHAKATGNVHNLTLADLGIANVENKSSAEIRAEITKEDIIKALGYEPSGGSTGGGDTPDPDVPRKTFAEATDGEIIQMVQAADAGQIDLAEDCGWEVGQEHTITLPAIPKSGEYDGNYWGIDYDHPLQQATLVLMAKGSDQTYDFVTPVKSKDGTNRIKPAFIVGLKNSLKIRGQLNTSGTNAGSWDSCKGRTWINSGFRWAMDSIFPGVFKKFTCITYASGINKTSEDYFSLFAEKEIIGEYRLSSAKEANSLTQIEYYKDSNHRIKYLGDGGSVESWWERSPVSTGNSGFCMISTTGKHSNCDAHGLKGISPFGCI